MRAIQLALLAIAAAMPSSGDAAPAANCTTEEAALTKDESELPRLEVVSTANRPVLCITLETVMMFAGRLKTHVARCPTSSHAATIGEWDKTRADYAKLFVQNRCKRTIFN